MLTHTYAPTAIPASYTEFVPKSARQNLVELPVNLFLPPGQVLPPGLHRWPFTFIVPENAIASFGFSATGVCTQGNGETSGGNASLACVVVPCNCGDPQPSSCHATATTVHDNTPSV